MYTPHTNAHAFAYDTVRVAHHHLSVYCTEYMNIKMNLSCSSRVHSVTSHNFTLQSMRGVEGGGGFGTLHGASSVAASFRASGLSFKRLDDSWKIYHSGAHFSFAEGTDDSQHSRRAYIETGTGNYVQPSSRVLKQNNEPFGGTLDRIERVLPVSYNYIGADSNTIGFVAEDLAEVMPEVISYDEDNSPGISYSLFGPIAISAIKEQQVIIRELQSKNTELEARLAAIEAKIEL